MTTPEPPPTHGAKTAAGLQAARERGVRLGRPEAPVPPAADRAAELRAAGLSLAAIARTLNEEKVAPLSGSQWTKSGVQYVLKRHDAEQSADGD